LQGDEGAGQDGEPRDEAGRGAEVVGDHNNIIAGVSGADVGDGEGEGAAYLWVSVAGAEPGDTLVVNSNGFRDDLWIDWNGSVITSAAKVQERIRRTDYGHLVVGVTVDDQKAYTRPWTVTLHQRLALNTELVDEICLENEKSARRMK
jgi:hypothetical protein